MNEVKNQILVIYVGVAGLRSEDIEYFVNKITEKISPTTFDGEIIILPIQSYDCRIECINPVYITETELIDKNNKLIKELNENLQFQLDNLKNNKNE